MGMPASAPENTAPRSQPQYGNHLRVPRLLGRHGGESLLLALIIEPKEAVPDNLGHLGRRLGVSRATASRWRRGLLDDGLAQQADGYLVPGPQAPDPAAGRDRLPLALLLLMLALFVFTLHRPEAWAGWVNAFAEAGMIGALADWFAVVALPSDVQRAEASGISRDLLAQARAMLVALGCGKVERVERRFPVRWPGGDHRTVRLTNYIVDTDRLRFLGACWTGEQRAADLAERSRCGRLAVASRDRGGVSNLDSTPLTPTVNHPSAPAPAGEGPGRDGGLLRRGSDGGGRDGDRRARAAAD